VSVLENCLADAVRSMTNKDGERHPKMFDSVICSTIKDFSLVLKSAAESSPETKFVMVEPILRPGLLWKMDNFDSLQIL
jgi:hypothetical protein